MTINDCFYIGYLTKTKGLKGEIQLFFECEFPDKLPLKTLFIEIDGKLAPYFVSSYKLLNNQTGLFFFDDIDSIEKAQKVVRKKVYLPNNQKPKRGKDEFTLLDLKGFTIYASLYGSLGVITAIHTFPKQYVASFFYKEKEIMLPMHDHFIQKIDKSNQVVYVTLPEGLIEVYLGI